MRTGEARTSFGGYRANELFQRESREERNVNKRIFVTAPGKGDSVPCAEGAEDQLVAAR